MRNDSSAVLDEFFNDAPFLMGVVECLAEDIRFIDGNAATERFFGGTSEAVFGQSLSALGVSPGTIRRWLGECREAGRTRRPVRFDECVRQDQVAPRWLSVTITPIRTTPGQPSRFGFLAEEVTESRQAEATSPEVEARNRAAWQDSEAELHALFQAMTDVILVLDRDGRYLRIAPTNPARQNRTDAELLGRTLHDIFPPDQAEGFLSRTREALRTGQTVHFEYQVVIGGTEVWFAAAVSPMRDDQVVWVARDITERKQHEHEQASMLTFTSALRAAQTRAEMLPIILDQLFAFLHVNAAALAMRDPNHDGVMIELAYGPWAKATGLRLGRGEGVCGQVIDTGQPYLNNNARAEDGLVRPGLRVDYPAQACVPLIVREQTIGAVWVARSAEIAPADLRLLSLLANIAASAIQRSTLHEQTARRMRRLQALRAIDLAITSSLDLSATLDVVLDQVIGQLSVHAAAILLYDPKAQEFEYAAERGFDSPTLQGSRLRLGESQAGQVALERRPIHNANLTAASAARRFSEQGFVTYYGLPLLANGQVKGVLEIFHRAAISPDPEWLDFLETLAGQATIAVDHVRLLADLFQSKREMAQAYDATIEGWSRALDMRDRETVGHTERVADLALRLAHQMGFSAEALVNVYRGALLHDIGKMGIPDNILHKPGPLSDDERAIMRKHPASAYELLAPIPYLRPALDIPYCHHEKWDGTGYPRGLKAEAIPLAARIFAVVDVWDALCSDRPYRAGWPKERVREHIRAEAGRHFDPQVVEVFLKLVDDDLAAPK